MADAIQKLGFKLRFHTKGQLPKTVRFSVAGSFEDVTLNQIWSEIRGCFPAISDSYETYGIFVALSKEEPVKLVHVLSDKDFRCKIASLGLSEKIPIECKEITGENHANVNSSFTTPEPPQSDSRATPSTAPKAIASNSSSIQFTESSEIDEIDLFEVSEKFQEYSQSVDDCKGKNAVVLFGQTGSGKTSTALYFLGARLITKESPDSVVLVDGTQLDGMAEESIALHDVDASRFEGFRINHSSRSETKVITTKSVDTTGFEIDSDGSPLQDLYVADLPGFDDSEGPQSDILQCVTSLNAIRGMHSIWPVFLIPCNALENRTNVQLVMKPLVRLIGRIFAPIEDYLPTEEETKSGKMGYLHFLFSKSDGKDIRWLLKQLSNLCDSKHTDSLGGPEITRLVKYLFHYVRVFFEKKQSGLLMLGQDHLVRCNDANHRCITLKRIVSATPIRDAPSLMCPLSEMTLSKLVAKVNEQATVVRSLFAHEPQQFSAACRTLHLLFVISEAVHDESVTNIFKTTLQFVVQSIRSLLESANVPMQSHNFASLHAVMMTIKSCHEALKVHGELRELSQEVDAKKKDLCKYVTLAANEARSSFFPTADEWTPADGPEEKGRLRVLQDIEGAFFSKCTHQFISQTTEERYPYVQGHLQSIICKFESIVVKTLKDLGDYADAETRYHKACINATRGEEATPIECPQMLDTFDVVEDFFRALTVSKRAFDNYKCHLISSFPSLRDDLRKFLTEIFQKSLLTSYCHVIKTFQQHSLASRLINCLDFLKKLEVKSILKMIDKPAMYESEISRIRQLCSGIFSDIDSNFQSKQYNLVHRDMQFLRTIQCCEHAQQFLPHDVGLKEQLIDRAMAKLCSDVKLMVDQFRDRETLEQRDCQKMVDLLKELFAAQCLESSEGNVGTAESKWSVRSSLDESLNVLTSECKTRCQNFIHGFLRHDDVGAVIHQLVRLSRMSPLQQLSAIQNSANVTPSIVAEFQQQMKEITENVICASSDTYSSLSWHSLETTQLQHTLVSIQWLSIFFEHPQNKFADMSGFARHECFMNFISMCQHRHDFLKVKLEEFRTHFKDRIEEQRTTALHSIVTNQPNKDMPDLKKCLDFVRELAEVACINEFLESIPSKRYCDIVDKLKEKILSLVAETNTAFEKNNYECVAPNREYFDQAHIFLSSHLPESVDINGIITRFSKQHSASTMEMRENLPQYLKEQKFREIAVCLLNLQRTKDLEPNDKTLFDQFNDDISAYLAELQHDTEDLDDDDPQEAISKLRNILERSQRTLCLDAVNLSGRNVVHVFKDILKCCWDRYDGLEKSILGHIKKYKFVQASKSFVLLRKFKCFDPVLRMLTSDQNMKIIEETQAKCFAAKIEKFKQDHIEQLYAKIVAEFQDGIQEGLSGYPKVAAIFKGVSDADSMDSTHSVLFAGILQFDDLSKDLSESVISSCKEKNCIAATYTGQSNFPQAQEVLECVGQFLDAIRGESTARNPKLLATIEEYNKQKSSLERARQNNVLKRFRFTSHEVPKCIELLNQQRLSDYGTFEASWKALEATLLHENAELAALTSKTYPELEDKDIQRVFEISSGIIRFGNEGESLLENHCSSHLFRSKVGEAPHSLAAFVKKVLCGYESQLKNFVHLADLIVMVEKLKVKLQDSGLQSWKDATIFAEKCSKIVQRCEKAINSVQEAISTVKEFDIKKNDQVQVKKLVDTLSHLRKQEKQSGQDTCDYDADVNSEDADTGKYKAVLLNLKSQICSTEKLRAKVESDHKIQRDSFEHMFSAMTNCRLFESDVELRDSAVKARDEAEKFLLKEINGVLGTFSRLLDEQNFQELDILVTTGKELDSIFFDSFISCFPKNQSLLRHFADAFASLLSSIKQSLTQRRDVKEFAQSMIGIRQLSTSVSNVALPEVRQLGDSMLKDIISKLPATIDLFDLGCELQAMDAAGREIVEDATNFPQFKAVKNAQFNKQTEGVSIEHALSEMKQSKPDDASTGRIPTLECECHRMRDLLILYHQTEEALLSKYLKGYTDFTHSNESHLVRQLQKEARELSQTWNPVPIINVLAGIGVVWTITASGKEFIDSGRKKETLLRLHNVQVIGLIRLLKLSEEEPPSFFGFGSIFSSRRKIMEKGHMIQVGTGEGKSVLLGILSCFLAMTDIQVRCACYSQLLSRRDYSDFEALFKKFNVESHIKYSTIDELAEECINEKGDIRALALRHVGRSSDLSMRHLHRHAPNIKKVLLIDEVDVFFSGSFMGKSYNPTAWLGSQNTLVLMRHIWQSRQQSMHAVLASMKQLSQYKELKQNDFSALATGMVDRELINMIIDAKAFNDPQYVVFNVAAPGAEPKMRVGYKRLDGMTTTLHYGYKTAFAWLCEAEKGTVPVKEAERYLQFQIPCGRFSYASIPKAHFDCVLGVTGTLSCLTANERNLIKQDYNIGREDMTYLPSLYGPSNMKFNPKQHIIVDPNEQRWQQTILKRINDEAVTRGRPMLVFFESEERIQQFLSSDYGRRMPQHQLIVESTVDVPFRVSKATAPRQVTLLSRVFGRGLDFKVNHPSIEATDGVCVICTFFPASSSEEIQIKGRAARQGKKGTFEFIVCEPDVLRDFSATAENLKDSPYEFLSKQRIAQTDQLLDAKKEQVKRCAPDHKKSMDLVGKLQSNAQHDGVIRSIEGFLRADSRACPIHTIFCLDDSGSMHGSWLSVKEAVRVFIEIRRELGSPADIFSCVQFSHDTAVPFKQACIDTAHDQASLLTLRGGGTVFGPALKCVSDLIRPSQNVAIVFMTDGASSDNPTAIAQSIMSQGAQISFFGVAFTPEGKTKTLQNVVQAFNGVLVEAADVSELRAQFEVIAQDPTPSHAK